MHTTTRMHTTIRTYKYWGPYYAPEKQIIAVGTISNFLYAVRNAMEDKMDTIAVFQDNQCTGIWELEYDVDSDGEGGLCATGEAYVLQRPHQHPKHFEFVANSMS